MHEPEFQPPPRPIPLSCEPSARLHLGDNLDFMRLLPDASIDLIYLDPPFNTGKRQHGRSRGATSDHADGVGSTLNDGGNHAPASFADTWPDIEAYLGFIGPRLHEAHRLLRPTGSLLLHCDWRTCHHLRVLLDALFGDRCFVNHLIWAYGLGGSSPRRFARKHDDILFYGRTGAYHFAPPRISATSRRMMGRTKKATDVLDIPAINNMARERTGYPTQKPLALLDVLVNACCPPGPGAVVADFFCGSGTTLVAAAAVAGAEMAPVERTDAPAGRRVIGCDISPRAIEITRTRLIACGVATVTVT